MKILIAGFAKLKYMPYLNLYLDNIDYENNEVHVLYWNRDGQFEEEKNNKVIYHEFISVMSDDISRWKKINQFLLYKRYISRIIKENDFDFLILLHTFPAVLIFKEIIKRYRYKYIFDYRDSTYEGKPFFKYIINKIVEFSKYTFVSSGGFKRNFFVSNQPKLFITHNFLLDSLLHRDDKDGSLIKSKKIRIGFWGFLREYEVNKVIIDNIGKDNRFELHYYGRPSKIYDKLFDYTKKNDYNNIFFHGEYSPEDRYTFILNTDLLHNIYEETNALLAMGNKYYDGVIFKIPQLCMRGSYMAFNVEKYRIGFVCNPYDNDFTEKVWQYYKKINLEMFNKNCDDNLKEIISDYNDIVLKISSL